MGHTGTHVHGSCSSLRKGNPNPCDGVEGPGGRPLSEMSQTQKDERRVLSCTCGTEIGRTHRRREYTRSLGAGGCRQWERLVQGTKLQVRIRRIRPGALTDSVARTVSNAVPHPGQRLREQT